MYLLFFVSTFKVNGFVVIIIIIMMLELEFLPFFFVEI